MAKSAQAFRTISEVAEWLDVPAHVLRFWESKFTQIKPVKRAGGRRYYRPQDMVLIGGIKSLLHDDGMTIKGVQKVLRERGVKHVSSLSRPLDGYLAEGLDDMVDIEATVAPEPDVRGEVVAFKPAEPSVTEADRDDVPPDLAETQEPSAPEDDAAEPEVASDPLDSLPDPEVPDADAPVDETGFAAPADPTIEPPTSDLPDAGPVLDDDRTDDVASPHSGDGTPPVDLVALMDSDGDAPQPVDNADDPEPSEEDEAEDDAPFSMLDMPGARSDDQPGDAVDDSPPAPPPFFASVPSDQPSAPATDPATAEDQPTAATGTPDDAVDDTPADVPDALVEDMPSVTESMMGGIGLSLDNPETTAPLSADHDAADSLPDEGGDDVLPDLHDSAAPLDVPDSAAPEPEAPDMPEVAAFGEDVVAPPPDLAETDPVPETTTDDSESEETDSAAGLDALEDAQEDGPASSLDPMTPAPPLDSDAEAPEVDALHAPVPPVADLTETPDFTETFDATETQERAEAESDQPYEAMEDDAADAESDLPEEIEASAVPPSDIGDDPTDPAPDLSLAPQDHEEDPDAGELPAFLRRPAMAPVTGTDNEPPETTADPEPEPELATEAEPEPDDLAEAEPEPDESAGASPDLAAEPAPEDVAAPDPDAVPAPEPLSLGHDIPPDPGPDDAMEPDTDVPSPLAILARIDALTPAQAQAIAPVLERLRARLDQV